GSLARLPNLQAIFSAGAGVDHILTDDRLPEVPIVRVVADDLTMRMSEYVVWQVLDHHRMGALYRRQQARHLWREELRQPAASQVTVGIMGLGALGGDAARKLSVMGFNVTGWSRRPKQVEGVTCHHGEAGLDPFLASADIVVVLLPLTRDTHGILDLDLFRRMKKEGPLGLPILINAGRGGLQNEADILQALDTQILGAAALDVFNEEPLPAGHPLWDHPRVTITPHAAASSDPAAIIPEIVRQMAAHEAGRPFENVVDRQAQY
ncbi:MAG TPA: glyoxylate/hydroxypyruvate reductase A, partial [Pararhizobium sp.]|nr:glyoxylate/hydroxypyruvate reductase A [Pararhizobium sp.]